MDFETLLTQIVELLQRQGRVSYGALKRRFNLDDAYLQDVKDELIDAQRIAMDEDGKVLVWTGASSLASSVQSLESEEHERTPVVPTLDASLKDSRPSAGERRQITVLFCDLVGSTALSTQLDPEDYQTLVQTYHQTCAAVIRRHEGYYAQPLGDGVLVYFGYPTAHEDDARRAVRTGLEIIEAVQKMVPSPLRGEGQGEGEKLSSFSATPHPHLLPQGAKGLQVRIGVHTGLVVVGEIGGGERRELLALGETPNLAARIQGLAEPNTMLMSAATHRLVDQQFESQPFGAHLLKGFDSPIASYHVQSERQYVSPLAGKETLTPLVGREQEVGLLVDHWEQVKEGRGQVVLLSGEPGIGKSRLALTLKEHITQDGSLLYEARCSPYHQHSALYPLIESLQRTLLFMRQDTEGEKVAKLEQALVLYGMEENLPFFTALFSLPTPEHYSPLKVSPQKQKERTFQTLLQLMAAQAERQATVSVWEDLHWADPSSLEFLSLLIDQIPTTKLLLVLTFRPEFRPPWPPRSHISQLVLNRLGKKQVEAMIEQAAAGKHLPAEVIEQIRLKTDGVPLFVEEVTKSVVENLGQQAPDNGQRGGQAGTMLGIPATLQEALLARLDRLSDARQVAQLGATLGREFSYELLHAVSPLIDPSLQSALAKLVEAEILYQRGVGDQARYFFKHALIQDTAYQSLLKSTRLQYHQQIARVLEEQFPDIKTNQPELLAHHYTEANLIEQAIPCWQKAGENAIERSANNEAISYLTRGLELLKTLPDTPERVQRELTLQIALGLPLILTKGHAAPEVGQVYSQARELCRQIKEPAQLFSVLLGLRRFYGARGASRLTDELGEQLLRLAQKAQDVALISRSHFMLTETAYMLGEFPRALDHAERGIALYDRRLHGAHAFQYGNDVGVGCLSFAGLTQWLLGYPDRALQRIQEALNLAQELAHPFSSGGAFISAAMIHQYRREPQATQEWAETAISISSERGFALYGAWGMSLRGWAIAECGQQREGIVLMRHSLVTYQRDGGETLKTWFLTSLVEVHRKIGAVEESSRLLSEALSTMDDSEMRIMAAELYRLKGELTLQKTVDSQRSTVVEEEAEACFLKAINIAQKQQAKSLELRASTSLARLWQSQGKKAEAYKLLLGVYNWFTEGFDTKDLQEAKELIEELSD